MLPGARGALGLCSSDTQLCGLTKIYASSVGERWKTTKKIRAARPMNLGSRDGVGWRDYLPLRSLAVPRLVHSIVV